MWLIYLIQNIMHKGISYNVSGLFFIAVVCQGKMKCQRGVFWSVGNCEGVVSLCPDSLVWPLILKSPKEIAIPIVASSWVLQWTIPSPEKTLHSSYHSSSSHFCYYQKISHNSLCSQSETDSLLSNSSLLTLCENPEVGLLPCSFRKY